MTSLHRLLPLRWILPLQVLLIVLAASASPLVPVETDSAMATLKQIADPDRFEGRKTGSEPGNASLRWMADTFDRWGLEPMIGESLVHEFPMLVTEERRAELTLLDTELYGDLELMLGTDFALTVNSGSGDVRAPVVFVGHGISKPEKGWDDYGDHDVSGKVVVIVRGRPSNGENWDAEYSRSYLFPEAVRRGAAAVLFYMGEEVIGGAAIMEKAYSPDVPSAVIGKRVFDLLLHGTGFDIEIYKRVLKQGPRVLEPGRRVRLRADVRRIEPGLGYNVVGVVPGTDPTRTDEMIVMGGHADHVGTNALGHVYPGADDNGSGTSVVMELARVFAQHPQPRPIAFMLFGAEEQGLLGSDAVAAALPDRYNFVAMVNLDMAGRGEGITGIGGGNAIPNAWFPFYDGLPDSVRSTIQARRAWGGFSSDHAPFREVGIPAFTSYSRGTHDHYHRTDDRYETIDTLAIGGVLDALSRWLIALANDPEPLAHPFQGERVVWHRGYGLATLEMSGDPEADLAQATEYNHSGLMGMALTTPAPTNDAERELFQELLDRYRDAIDASPNHDLTSTLTSIRGSAYNLKSAVYLTTDGDGMTDADTTAMEIWAALGLSRVRLQDPNAWVMSGEMNEDRAGILSTWRSLETVVDVPLYLATRWVPVSEAVGGALFTGTWDEWGQVSEQTLQRIVDSGGHIVLAVPHGNLNDAIEDQSRIARHRVHVQPASTDYDEILAWVRLAEELGLEKEILLEWIGGHFARWK